jgi:hypothetical protein
MDIIEKIKNEIKDEGMLSLILPKVIYQIENPDSNYGIISPMYSLMPCFFDYFNVDVLTSEQQNEAERIINIVDTAFGGGWDELSIKMSIKRCKQNYEFKDLE